MLGDEIGEQLALVETVADRHLEGHGGVGLDRADTVDAGDGGDDDAVVRSSSERVAEWRMRSICSLIEDSFSI
ncbi:hypothetical protein AJ87_30235 [Rhizobium yanglingense]|nr:hypothetical protein AJ87_30235 [Rhizobium yanglingense]